MHIEVRPAELVFYFALGGGGGGGVGASKLILTLCL